MTILYRALLGSLRTAQRAAGNTRLRLHIRRAALSLQRQLEVVEP
ncbi:MAG TPA: hypothetical protein VF134_02300 [Candidatus Dormibacteraeota bacterium]